MVGTSKTWVRIPPSPPKGVFGSLFYFNLMSNKLPVVVVYKIVYRKKETIHIKVFEGILIDEVIEPNKRKPLVPNDAEILDIGVGISFLKRYKTKYKVEVTETEESPQEKVLKELQTIVNNKRVN